MLTSLNAESKKAGQVELTLSVGKQWFSLSEQAPKTRVQELFIKHLMTKAKIQKRKK